MMQRIGSVLTVLLLLTGCAAQSQNAAVGTGNQLSPSPSGAIQSSTPSPAAADEPGAPSQEARPGTNGEPSATAATSTAAPGAYLDTGKLQSSFGFADSKGRHILATSEENTEGVRMKSMNTAIGNNGQVLSVEFEKWQPGSSDSNGREMANNFANLSGYVFTVKEGSASPDETYYLADSAEFNLKSLLRIQPAGAGNAQLGSDAKVRKDIAAAKKRDIHSIWKLADLPGVRELYLVQFVRLDKDMLFSLVLREGAELSFMDYPAQIQSDEYSVWRVDDGGEVTPNMFSLLFAAETANGLVLGLDWWGSEGVNSYFLIQQGNAFKEMDIKYSRYTSPV